MLAGRVSDLLAVPSNHYTDRALYIFRQWTVISIYYGSYFRQTENAYRLTVRILDMDSQVGVLNALFATILS